MKNRAYLPVLTLLVAVTVLAALLSGLGNGTAHLTQEMLRHAQQRAQDNPYLELSGDPYDYLRGDGAFERLVALGPAALPSLERTLRRPGMSLFQQSLVALAMEEIAKFNLAAISQDVMSVNLEYLEQWNQYKGQAATLVEQVLSSGAADEEKRRMLSQLGLLALPSLMDRRSADASLAPLLDPVLLALTQLDREGMMALAYSSAAFPDGAFDPEAWRSGNGEALETLRLLTAQGAD